MNSYLLNRKKYKQINFDALRSKFISVIVFFFLLCSISTYGKSSIIQNYQLPQDINSLKDTLKDKAVSTIASGVAKTLTPKQIKKIDNVINRAKKIREECRYIHKLINSKKSFNLPIGKTQNIADGSVTISIDSIFLTPIGGYLNASALIDVPASTKMLAFEGDHIGFNKGGFTGDARLMLIGNVDVSLGNNTKLYFIGANQKTFVDWDCNGYTGMSLEGVVEFDNGLLKPVKKGQTNVYGHFVTDIVNFSDFVADISLDPFEVKGLKDFKFTVTNAVIDQSEKKNSLTMKFPDGYQSTSMPEKNSTLWKGFYLEKLNVELPSQFRKEKQQKNIELFLEKAIVDEMGFTGFMGAKNIFPIEQGDMGGWAYSLDELAVGLRYNKFNEAYFKGDLLVPLASKKDSLSYYALIQPDNNYLIRAEVKSDINFDKLSCDAKLAKSSYLEVEVEDGRFSSTAFLSGWLKPKNMDLMVEQITFQELYLSSKAPYFDVKLFDLGLRKSSFGQFPIQINKISMKRRKTNEYGIGIDMDLNLCPSFAGGAEAIIVTQKNPDKVRFKYQGLDVGRIAVKVDNDAYSIDGEANWFKEDPIYGKGFQGMVEAKFQPGITVQASALFGNVKGNRYWYVDGMYTDPTGVPVFPPYLSAYSFGGGMFYKMRQAGLASSKHQLGATPSGILYQPDEEAGLGLRAMVKLASTDKNAVTINTFYEMAFNRRGGLDYISFEGNGKFMSPLGGLSESEVKNECNDLAGVLSDAPSGQDIRFNSPGSDGYSSSQVKLLGSEDEVANQAAIAAKAKIKYDFNAKSLHASFRVYMNLGRGVIQGVGPAGLAGWAELHYDPKDWYFFMGTPENRVGVKIFNGLKTESYFMVGTKIHGSPPPPKEVSEILGADDLDYMRDFNALGDGKGFAFGSSVSLSTGNVDFLIFYGHFSAGAGFDIMLKNYGNNVRCKGSGETPGIDGWYANGQAYAYIDGEIGIKVKVFGKRKKIKILDIGVAALLQAQLPNPLWMKGIVGGRYSVLGGLVKGKCKFEVQIGDKCEIVGGSVLDQLDVISDVTPQTGKAEVDVFTAVQAVFNMEVEKPFSMVDVDEIEKTYRIKLEEMSLKDDKKSIDGEIQWNDKRDVAIFNSLDILPPQKEIEYRIKVQFEQKVGNVWKHLDGQTQEVKGYFRTGEAPDHIPARNVAYSYPMPNQFNFFKNEYSKGYIKLIKGQPYLFEPDQKWDQKMRMTCKDGSALLGDISYSDYKVHYTIPKGLKDNSIYLLNIVNIPKFKGDALDSNVEIKESGNDDATISNKKAEEGSSIVTVEDKIIYGSYFRTSKYKTFKEKFRKIKFGRGWEWPISTGIYTAYVQFTCPEIFGYHDMQASEYSKSLIQFEAKQNNSWMKQLKPLMYTEYPLKRKYKLDWRNANTLGTPPVYAIDIEQEVENPSITAKDFSGPSPSSEGQNFNVAYNLAQVAFGDFTEYRNKIAADALNTNLPDLRRLLDKGFPFQKKDKYKVIIRYVLPGINQTTYENEIVVPYLY